ncbi:hypothetical protein K08M4_26820 [Vibrio syngnathi]|uniref:Uncharacterized protein n=1 Tax=Vibrio syngnathi TaxID=3034029 RepID=A0AA34TRS6_9VIBR|nr:hypothetical protein K08M4_26820 [Vibrio syngnathi]
MLVIMLKFKLYFVLSSRINLSSIFSIIKRNHLTSVLSVIPTPTPLDKALTTATIIV